MSDRIAGALFLLLAIWYGTTAGSFEQGFGDPVGPAAFPQMLSVPMGIFALFLILRPDPAAGWPGGLALVRQVAMLAVLVVYPLILELAGFPLATALALFGSAMLLGARVPPAALASVGLAVGLFVLFDQLLGLHLPMLPKLAG